MTNEQIIGVFYEAFARGDAEGMIKYYADDITFQDPAFGILHGDDAKNMWRMLLKNPGIKITATNIHADHQTGSADWVAEYTFTITGKKVINHVSARFEFNDGKITKHTDHFSFWKWVAQAFGIKGWLLGWTPLMRNKVSAQAFGRLRKFKG